MYPNYINDRKDLGFAVAKDKKSTAELISVTKKLKDKSAKIISLSSLLMVLNFNNIEIKSLKTEKNSVPIFKIVARGGGNEQNSIPGLDLLKLLLEKDQQMKLNIKESIEEERKINEQLQKQGLDIVLIIKKNGITFSLPKGNKENEIIRLHILDPDTKIINCPLNINHKTTGTLKITSYILSNDRTGEQITRNLITEPDKKIPEINIKPDKKIETYYLANDKTGIKINLNVQNSGKN